MPGLLDSIEPQIQQGLLDYLKQGQQPANPFLTAGRALSAFSANYNQALQDPRTRGTAFGAGFAGAGQTLSEDLDPNKRKGQDLEALLKVAGVATDIEKVRAKDAGTTTEFERLLQARGSEQYKLDEKYRASVDARIRTFEEEGNDPSKGVFFQALDEFENPNTSPERKALLKRYIDSQSEGNSPKINIGLPQISIDNRQPLTKETTNVAQKAIFDYDDRISSLDAALNNYDPSTGTIPGQLKNTFIALKEKLGGKLSEDQQNKLISSTTSQAAVGEISSRIGNELFGAAFTGAESTKANAFLPVLGESPTVTKAKLGYLKSAAEAARDRRALALSMGLNLEQAENPETVRALLGDIGKFIKDPEARRLYETGSLEDKDTGGGTAAPPPVAAAPPPGPGLLPAGPPDVAAAPPGPPGGLLPQAAPPPGPPPGAGGPGGLLPAGPPPGAMPQPNGGGAAVPPGAAGPMPGAMPPGPMPGAGGPSTAPQLPPGISFQAGKIVAPKPADRAQANTLLEAFMQAGLPDEAIARWLQENGY